MPSSRTRSEYDSIRRGVIAWIDRRFQDPDIVLNDYCVDAHRSRRSVQRALKSFNTSWSRLVIEARMFAAIELLLETQLEIRDIALDCGYTNSSHFGTAFVRERGKTPTKFREEQKNG